jgi:ferredoxin-NAD(P)+ reductase (naphthalene dioxygenase ferredoxin-specific)
MRFMELTILPLQRTLGVHAGDNLLEVLRDNAVPVSYSCMAGRCGTCRCRVLAGHVQVNGAEQSRAPIAGETILACQATLTQDCVIEIAEADEIVVHPAKVLKATVAGIEDLTHDIKRVRLALAKPFEFSPGQYATLQFTPEHIRPYSMTGTGTADAREVEFHIRLVPGGRVTSYVAHELSVGQSVRLSGPLGTAYLRHKHDGPILCVAGGTGLAPMLSILRGIAQAGMCNPVHLYFGVRASRDIYGLDWLESLRAALPNLNVQIVVASGETPSGYRTGVVTDVLNQDWQDRDMRDWRAYLAGPPVMTEAVSLLLRRKSLDQDRIYADAFYPSGI